MIRLDSVETEKYQLEVGECDCGYHFGVDTTFLDQVKDFRIDCPSCSKSICTACLFHDIGDEACLFHDIGDK